VPNLLFKADRQMSIQKEFQQSSIKER